MNLRGQIGMWTLGIALALGLAAAPSRVAAQDKDHVVSLDELKSDAAKPAQTRADGRLPAYLARGDEDAPAPPGRSSSNRMSAPSSGRSAQTTCRRSTG